MLPGCVMLLEIIRTIIIKTNPLALAICSCSSSSSPTSCYHLHQLIATLSPLTAELSPLLLADPAVFYEAFESIELYEAALAFARHHEILLWSNSELHVFAASEAGALVLILYAD